MNGVATVTDWIFFSYGMLIFAAVLLTWIPFTPRGDVGRRAIAMLRFLTRPVLEAFRRIVPQLGPFDFSPVIALLALGLARSLVVGFLTSG